MIPNPVDGSCCMIHSEKLDLIVHKYDLEKEGEERRNMNCLCLILFSFSIYLKMFFLTIANQ